MLLASSKPRLSKSLVAVAMLVQLLAAMLPVPAVAAGGGIDCQANAEQKPIQLTPQLALLAGDVISFRAVRSSTASVHTSLQVTLSHKHRYFPVIIR